MLTALNAALHADLEEGLLTTLDALTALDLPAAQERWGAFVGALERHKAVEDDVVFLRYAELGPFERGGSPELLDADHRSLDKVLGTCHEALAALEGTPETGRRRAMVHSLEVFLRLRRVLEHHGLREERMCYPRLDARLSVEEQQELADQLGR